MIKFASYPIWFTSYLSEGTFFIISWVFHPLQIFIVVKFRRSFIDLYALLSMLIDQGQNTSVKPLAFQKIRLNFNIFLYY